MVFPPMHISGQKFIYPHFLIPKLNGVVHKIVRRVTFSRQYLGWSKNILPYYLRQILWLCIERVLMVCGGMFGVWSRVDGVGNKIYIIKKIMGIICSYRIAYVPPS